MSEVKKAGFQFRNFVVSESHIVFKEAKDLALKVSIEPKGIVFQELNQFHLILDVDVTSEDQLNISLKTVSVFAFPADSDIEVYKQSFFVGNAPAITFPYIRAYIGALTTLSGLPSIMLPTLNMVAVGKDLADKIEIH